MEYSVLMMLEKECSIELEMIARRGAAAHLAVVMAVVAGSNRVCLVGDWRRAAVTDAHAISDCADEGKTHYGLEA